MDTSNGSLPAPAGLGIDSAFVVHVHADSVVSAGRTRGRIEHVPSGRSENFVGLRQMLGFIRKALGRPEEDSGEGEGNRPTGLTHEPHPATTKRSDRRSRSSETRDDRQSRPREKE